MQPSKPTMKFFQFISCFLSIFCTSNGYAFSSWQGSYLGAYLGGAFANHNYTANAGGVTSSSYFTTASDISAINQAASPNRNASNPVFGMTAGHDYTWRKIVLGVVADYGAMPLNSSHTVSGASLPSSGDQYNLYTSMSTNWLMTLRGRLGYPSTLFQYPSLLYVTGGLAVSQVKINNHYSDSSSLNGAGNSQSAENLIGWAAGVGVEILTFPNTTVDIEYLYTELPSVNTTANISNSVAGFGVPVHSLTSPLSSNGSIDTNIIRLGVNYRFDV